jgi:hypothetical protein
VNEPDVQLSSDDELLALARSVLSDEGYAVEDVRTGDVVFLLAENAYFLVGVSATPTIAQLLLAEGLVEAALSDRLSSSDAGPKIWDTYLVLLTQERSPETPFVTKGLYEINYDTARLRRIAHAGVDASRLAVSSALSPFIAPLELENPVVTENPFESMVRVLTTHGVEQQVARRAVDAFEQGVPLANVL